MPVAREYSKREWQPHIRYKDARRKTGSSTPPWTTSPWRGWRSTALCWIPIHLHHSTAALDGLRTAGTLHELQKALITAALHHHALDQAPFTASTRPRNDESLSTSMDSRLR